MPITRRAFLSALAPIALLGCATVPRAHADVVLTSQPTVVNPANVGLGFYSSSHPRSTRNFKRGDDFILPTAANLTRIRWWGQSEGRIFDDLRNFNQYTIEVFDSIAAPEGPLPGPLLWSRVFTPSSDKIFSPRSFFAQLPEPQPRRWSMFVLIRSLRTKGSVKLPL